MIRAVLFDLDGTLLDTAPDLGNALNEMRRRRGLPPLPQEHLRPQASHGTHGLLRLGFGLAPDHPDFPALRLEFLDIYQASLTVHTRLFPGMDTVLDALEGRDIAWGVVTNKPARFTLPLMESFNLLSRAACVVSGDTCAQPKPHPEPVLHACRLAGVAPGECIYVGDAERDIIAARAATMPAIVALYGYLGEDDQPQTWQGDACIHQPAGLLDYLDNLA